MRMRWIVAGRCVVLLNISGRCSATFTGRPGARAPSAASTASDAQEQLAAEAAADEGRDDPHVLFRQCRASSRGRCAPQSIIWFDVQSVSLSPSHAAMVACGSIIACAWSGVV